MPIPDTTGRSTNHFLGICTLPPIHLSKFPIFARHARDSVQELPPLETVAKPQAPQSRSEFPAARFG